MLTQTAYRDHGYITGSKPFPTPKDACITGICTGLITAAAVSHASSVSDLLLLGLQSVTVAFRVGACAWDVGSRFTAVRDAAGRYRRWTATILGLTTEEVEEALRKFSEERVSDFSPLSADDAEARLISPHFT